MAADSTCSDPTSRDNFKFFETFLKKIWKHVIGYKIEEEVREVILSFLNSDLLKDAFVNGARTS
jgi:hypothetical protein